MTSDQLLFELSSLFQGLNNIVGKPIKPSPKDMEKIKNEISANFASKTNLTHKNFFLILQINGELNYVFNIEKYLNIPSPVTLDNYFALIKEEYLSDYLCWGIAAYKYGIKIKEYLEPLNLIYRIRIPLKLKDGCYYWVLQESSPLQFDKNNIMYSHLNSYTITERYVERSYVGVTGEMYYNDIYHEKFTKDIFNSMLSKKAFILSPPQIEIVKYFRLNPSGTVKGCAESMKYPLNTIKKYISNSQLKSGIIDKAKLSFPDQNIKSLKDTVSLLSRIGWFY